MFSRQNLICVVTLAHRRIRPDNGTFSFVRETKRLGVSDGVRVRTTASMSGRVRQPPVGFPGLITAIARTFWPADFALAREMRNSSACGAQTHPHTHGHTQTHVTHTHVHTKTHAHTQARTCTNAETNCEHTAIQSWDGKHTHLHQHSCSFHRPYNLGTITKKTRPRWKTHACPSTTTHNDGIYGSCDIKSAYVQAPVGVLIQVVAGLLAAVQRDRRRVQRVLRDRDHDRVQLRPNKGSDQHLRLQDEIDP